VILSKSSDFPKTTIFNPRSGLILYNSRMRFPLNSKFISKLMLAVMLFVSLAPTVSHALAAWTGDTSFVQKICTSAGKTVVIQVKTTMGQQLLTALSVKPLVKPDNDERHVAHCAFCSQLQAQAILPSVNPFIIQALERQAWQMALYAEPVLHQSHHLSPPSHAPPNS
jgi:hypothetical protein